MGYIQGVALSYWQFIRIFIFSPLMSPFIVPVHLVQQYKYTHNPEYKRIVDERDNKEEQERRQKVKEFQEKLQTYIENDMLQEEPRNITSEEEVF